MLSWFAVLRPAGLDVQRMTVRLEDGDVWGTVRFLTRQGGVLLRVKEFVYDWGFSHGNPINLSTGAWEAYRTPVSFPVQHDFVGFHGVDYSGKEAGSVVMHDTHVEVEVVEGELGVEGIRAFMATLSPVDPEVAEWIEAKPFALKSYHARRKRPPWPAMPTLARMDWYVDAEPVERRIGSALPLAFDSVGLYVDSERHLWEMGGKLKGDPPATFLYVRTDEERRLEELKAERIREPQEFSEREPLFTHVEDLALGGDLQAARYGDLPPLGPGAAYLDGRMGIEIVWFSPSRSHDRTRCKTLAAQIYRTVRLPSTT